MNADQILPDDVDFEDIMEIIHVQQKIAHGLSRLDVGEFVTHEEMKNA